MECTSINSCIAFNEGNKLPESMRNPMLEVIVCPAVRKGSMRENANEIEAAIHAISGIILDNDMSLEEYREERFN